MYQFHHHHYLVYPACPKRKIAPTLDIMRETIELGSMRWRQSQTAIIGFVMERKTIMYNFIIKGRAANVSVCREQRDRLLSGALENLTRQMCAVCNLQKQFSTIAQELIFNCREPSPCLLKVDQHCLVWSVRWSSHIRERAAIYLCIQYERGRRWIMIRFFIAFPL